MSRPLVRTGPPWGARLLAVAAAMGLLGAVEPLPPAVTYVPTGPGVPETTCAEDLEAARLAREARAATTGTVPKEPGPPDPALEAAAWHPAPPRPWGHLPPQYEVDTMPQVVARTLDDVDLPGEDPATLPTQPLEGRPEDLEAIRRVFVELESGGRASLVFFGASHTEGDYWTGHLRRLLQDRFGDLGHGWILPAAHSGYRGQDVNRCQSDGWAVDWPGRREGRADGLYGVHGLAVTSADPDAFAWVQTTVDNHRGRAFEMVDLYLLGWPTGGTLLVTVDGGAPVEVSTRTPSVELIRRRLYVGDGPHRVEVRPKGDGEVRLFGANLFRGRSGLGVDGEGGVLVHALGIRGKTARSRLDWHPDMAAVGLASLYPSLVVLAYGTNEGNDPRLTLDQYRDDLEEVLTRLRAGAPEVPCVLVGPSDRAEPVRRDHWAIWTRTAEIAQVQREVAPEFRCAFWDWQAATGGPGSAVAWRLLQPPLLQKDGIHFTREGYERSAELFLAALEQRPAP